LQDEKCAFEGREGIPFCLTPGAYREFKVFVGRFGCCVELISFGDFGLLVG